jgi:TonB family protein
VVEDRPYLGWAFVGLLIGATISALIRWQLLSWPQIADKPARIQTLEAIKAGSRLARRHFVLRLVVGITTWSLLLWGLWANQGTGNYPWTATFKEKVDLVEHDNGAQVPFLLRDAIRDGMHQLESPMNNEDGVVAHAEGLRLLLGIQSSSHIQSIKERASTLQLSYKSKAELLVREPPESNLDEGLYMAKAIAAAGDAQGYMLMGFAYEEGIGPGGDGIDFRLAYEAYQKAAEKGLPEGRKANNELIKGPLESQRFTENVVAYELLEKEANTGDPNAQVWMGYSHTIGEGGVARDIAKARYWYSLASKQEDNNEARKRALLGLQALIPLEQRDKPAKIAPTEKGDVKEVLETHGEVDSGPLSDRAAPESVSESTTVESHIPEQQVGNRIKIDTNTPFPSIEPSWKAEGYLSTVQEIIRKRWLPIPIPARQSASTVVQFRIDRSGEISEVKIEHSSGDASYDEAARRAVINTNLPAFSPEMPDAFLDAHMRFSVGN